MTEVSANSVGDMETETTPKEVSVKSVVDMESESTSKEVHENGQTTQEVHAKGHSEQEICTGGESDGRKRSAEENSELHTDSPAKKRRSTASYLQGSVLSKTKNPIMTLNESHPGLQYKTEDIRVGPALVFTVTVEVNGKVFKGTGKSKKEAKTGAAEAALGIESSVKNQVDNKDNNVNENSGESLTAPGEELVSSPKKSSLVSNSNKNPVQRLNESCQGVEYIQLQESGMPHAKTFTYKAIVDGQSFEGSAVSKKLAKAAAAAAALQSLGIDSSATNQGDKDNNVDGNNDESSTASGFNINKNGSLVLTGEDLVSSPKKLSLASNSNKNPVQLLNESCQGVEYIQLEESGMPHAKTFTYKVIVDGQSFEGSAESKKLAKAAAASKALSELCGVVSNSSAVVVTDMSTISLPDDILLDKSLADKIAQLICDKIVEITDGNPTIAKRKVLAGIVMTNDSDKKDIRVITCSTGTKCINGERLSLQGLCINDCHAEIVSRRCLMHFLYNQIGKCLDAVKDGKKNNSIIEAYKERGYRVKPQFKFHLYINTATCGDGRIFAPHEEMAEKSDKHPNRQSRGLLRTKIESGEGTIPLKTGTDTIQTWDGVLQGERLRTMSCSDKVARWNVLGLQGSLLSLFLSPVYLESVILGSLFNASHMYRAVGGRIEQTLEGLPAPFKLNQPKMNQGNSTTEPTTPVQKAPTISVNWDCEDQQLEVLNAMTGRQDPGEMNSRLCKREFLKHLQTLLDHPAAKPHTEVDAEAIKEMSYGEVKALSKDYQSSKKAMCSAFIKAGLGNWISKPLEQDFFSLD